MTDAWNPVSERASRKENAAASRGKACLQLLLATTRQSWPRVRIDLGQIEVPQDLKGLPESRYCRRRCWHLNDAKFLLQRAAPEGVAPLSSELAQRHAQMTPNSPVDGQPSHPLLDRHVGPRRLPRLFERKQMNFSG